MYYTVTGCKITDFVNDDGERIQGVKLYLILDDNEDDSFYGVKATSRFIATDSKWFKVIYDYVAENNSELTPVDLQGCIADMEFTEDKKVRKFKLYNPKKDKLPLFDVSDSVLAVVPFVATYDKDKLVQSVEARKVPSSDVKAVK